MKGSSKKSPRSPAKSPHKQYNSYPIPAYLNFVPGGIEYGSNNDQDISLRRNWHALNQTSSGTLVAKAHAADKTLRKYSLRFAHNEETQKTTVASSAEETLKVPHRLPSLSILAEAVFGQLTGVHATSVRKWADDMVLAYLDDDVEESASESLERTLAAEEKDLMDEFHQLINSASPVSPPARVTSPAADKSPQHNKNDLISILKNMHQKQVEENNSSKNPLSQCLPVRPCGYVFKQNDIAWNCRTCQTDSTCVLCDTCFHASDHEGHDVYFHRTSPGGCCDCGDPEAWRIEGCCPNHRPRGSITVGQEEGKDVQMTNIADSLSALSEEKIDFEAVKASLRGRADGHLCVSEMLPPRLAAALGVVIGAAVQTTIQAIDGAAIGADPVQWTRRWADQVRRIHDGCSVDEEYVLNNKMPSAKSVGEAMDLEFPNRFKLHLRLHNDDVHTYDEVIESLHQQQGRLFNNASNPKNEGNGETDTTYGIVNTNDQAKDLTSHVDSDGQVIVKGYNTFEGAKAGYKRLKKYGLHCAVVSVPQTDLEIRARILLSWLAEISAAHPAVAALVVHALVDVTEGSDPLGGAYVWANSRIIPPWSFSNGYFSSARVSIHEEAEEEGAPIPNWRRRMDVFPPNMKSSFLTREELRQLHKLGLAVFNDMPSPKKGWYKSKRYYPRICELQL